ncbi:MAG: YicC/YloC family endoribonuclease, partial [Rhodocyclaceae bacterium]|nr:YicC/YloC family endoribonuclease [Rhodocyclaceae bacterium]
MTIYSMTGYAAGTRELGPAALHMEVKSVNSRFLDITFRCGEELRFLEMPLREKISAALGRGKVECRLNLAPQATAPRELAPNLALVTQLARLEKAVRATLPEAA